ncbi:MAG: NYN domain-containing protein, partial [Oscillospiraceae bacterium]|nr:NYN domain-containing protein [Oscillospiraceae bacterium]
RALTDLQRMDAQMSPPDISGSDAVITGSAPMSGLSHYMREVRSYTGGSGSLITAFDGYKPCRDAESVIEAAAYDPTADLANSPDSVFCIHGAGTVIRWDMVRDYMHTEESSEPAEPVVTPAQVAQFKARLYSDDELMAIFERTYGKIERPKRYAMRREPAPGTKVHRPKTDPDGKDYLIADGYNLIFAWDELKALARDNLDLARKRLTDILINYTGFNGCETILVFDAYRTSEERRIERVNNITVVYTKEAETADMYIERAAHELRPKARRIRVATSDYAEQLIILGSGALRISAREFEEETKQTAEAIRSLINSE